MSVGVAGDFFTSKPPQRMDVESTDYRATALLDPSIRSSETTRMFVEYLNSILSVSEPVLEPAVDKIDDATRIRLR